MNKGIVTFIVSAIVGLVGIYLGALLNLEGYLGIILLISSVGALIVSAIEDTHSK